MFDFFSFLGFFRRKPETDEEITNRLLKLCGEGDYGICSPPMEHDIAIKELSEFFLGKDRCTDLFLRSGEDFTEIVLEIKNKCQHDFSAEKGVYHSPMSAYDAILDLCKFFLGEGWYISVPVSPRQANTEIVYEIERKHQHLKYTNFK